MAVNISIVKTMLVKESTHHYEVTKQIHNPDDAVSIVNAVLNLDKEAQEVFVVLLLDTKNKVNQVSEITRGTANASLVHPREVFRAAILANASSIICMHNHPSGDPDPSREDFAATERLRKSGKLLDIPVLDHIVVGSNRKYYSFKERGVL